MMEELSLKETQKEWLGTFTAYAIGLVLCLTLTFISFGLAYFKPFEYRELRVILVCLALIQAAVQLIFFLHLGQEPKPRWETVTFIFMAAVLVITVLGSLWIMYDLEERVMSTMTMDSQHD